MIYKTLIINNPQAVVQTNEMWFYGFKCHNPYAISNIIQLKSNLPGYKTIAGLNQGDIFYSLLTIINNK